MSGTNSSTKFDAIFAKKERIHWKLHQSLEFEYYHKHNTNVQSLGIEGTKILLSTQPHYRVRAWSIWHLVPRRLSVSNLFIYLCNIDLAMKGPPLDEKHPRFSSGQKGLHNKILFAVLRLFRYGRTCMVMILFFRNFEFWTFVYVSVY